LQDGIDADTLLTHKACHRRILSALLDNGGDMTRTQKQRMLAGEQYTAADAQIRADQDAARVRMERYNGAVGLSQAERHRLLAERLRAVGEGVALRPPFFYDYGYNISLGDGECS
jgi:maltose O-acetyltransferase